MVFVVIISLLALRLYHDVIIPDAAELDADSLAMIVLWW